MKPAFITTIEKHLKDLLETKHLYQKYQINFKPDDLLSVTKAIRNDVNTAHHALVQDSKNIALFKDNWNFHHTIIGMPPQINTNSYITIPTIKIYCNQCKRIEPYNPLKEINNPVVSNFKNYQLFTISYECQSCKEFIVTFMIKREGDKLFICGRSPIEHVEVSKVIPKEQQEYYSGAIVAYNSGQTLVSLFLLRTFIEQYIASIIPKNTDTKVDELIEKYMETLPNDFKKRFPSLAKLYSDLSSAIHRAQPSKELFESTIIDINEHFDARKLYKLYNPTSSP